MELTFVRAVKKFKDKDINEINMIPFIIFFNNLLVRFYII